MGTTRVLYHALCVPPRYKSVRRFLDHPTSGKIEQSRQTEESESKTQSEKMRARGATIVAYAVLMGGITSCVNLSHIHDFSTAATTSLDKYADIGFSATGYCREILCLDPSSYQDGILRKVEKCDC